jgi:hypothetical protein
MFNGNLVPECIKSKLQSYIKCQVVKSSVYTYLSVHFPVPWQKFLYLPIGWLMTEVPLPAQFLPFVLLEREVEACFIPLNDCNRAAFLHVELDS